MRSGESPSPDRPERAYTVIIDRVATKSLLSLPEKVQTRIQERVNALRSDPGLREVRNCWALTEPTGSVRASTGWCTRLRTTALVILVVRIGHRKDVYWDM